MQLLFSLAILLFAGSTWAAALVEVAPLRTTMGQLAARGEARLKLLPQVAIGGGLAFDRRDGKADWTNDESQQVAAEALWYPGLPAAVGLFVGAGLGYERSYVGRMRERPTVSNVTYNADESYDRWADEVTTVSSLQTLGYRAMLGWFTCAVRLTFDHALSSTAKVVDANVKSPYSDPSASGRTSDLKAVTFYAGIGFP